MKKLLFLAIVLTSCGPGRISDQDAVIQDNNGEHQDFKVRVVDSCEYIIYEMGVPFQNNYSFSITHKGNCKYCLTRNQNK